MDDSHKDKTYLIAGGSKGIGLALTQQLLESGANVHVFSRTDGDLPENERLTHRVCDFSRDDFESVDPPNAIHGVAYCGNDQSTLVSGPQAGRFPKRLRGQHDGSSQVSQRLFKRIETGSH